MNHSKHWLRLGMVALAVSSFALMGCEEKSTESGNSAPEIVSITASSTSISQGAETILVAVVTDDDGDTIEFRWSAPKGTFSSTDNDTVTWTSPEVEEIVTIELEVNDGINISKSTIDIGVDVYVPAVQPYYLGAEACSGCHSSTYAAWQETHHADAATSILESDHGADYCFECHTTGYDTELANGGFDDNPVSSLHNVQCENCHGPASAHVAGGGDVSEITLSVSEDVCAGCHVSTRNNGWSDWEAHQHNVGHTIYEGSYYSGCGARCHSGSGYIEEVSGSAVSDTTFISINCITCHDPHDATNDHQIRLYPNGVTAPNGDTVTKGGLGNLCLGCHTGRRSADEIEDQVANGSSHFGPHHGNQGAFLYPDVFFVDVVGSGFVWSSSQHLLMEDSCVTCHMEGHDGVNEYGSPNTSGHAYEPSVEACEPCHGVLADFDDVMAKNDYDGDGAVEGVQSEVIGLTNLLLGALVATGLDTTGVSGDDAFDVVLTTVGFPDDSTSVWSAVLTGGLTASAVRASGFNMATVLYDHSHGVHNAAFTIQLLQQSYKNVAGSDVPNAHVLSSGEK